jgi:hypothetical protein
MPALLFNISKNQMKTIDQIWNGILSRDCRLILEAYKNVERESQETIVNHLRKMVTEEGWHLEQTKSARIALDCICKSVKG